MQVSRLTGPVRWSMTRAVAVIAAALLAGSAASVIAAVVDIDQIPARDQLMKQLGSLADIQDGVTALEAGDFVTATTLARSYIGRNPTDSKAHLLLVLALYGQRDDGRLDAHLTEVDTQLPALGASLRETVAGLYLRDGRSYRAGRQLEAIPIPRRTDQSEFLAAAIAGRQGNVADARARIGKLAAKLPDNVALAINQSRLALMATDFDAAAAAAERALAASPKLEAALLLLGTARMQQGRPAEALEAFRSIQARNPTHGPSALSVGLIHLAGGRHAEAMQAFRTARSLGKGDARPYFAEATAAFASGDEATARSAIAAARKQNPEDSMAALVDVLVRRPAPQAPDAAAARSAAGQYFPDLRREPLPRAIAAEIADTKAARRLAVANVLAHTWSGDAALRWMGAATAGDGPMLTLTRARALASVGKWEDAERVLAALKKAPIGAGLVGPLAQGAGVAAARKQGPQAVAQLRQAIQLAPEVPSLNVTLGDLYNSLGEPAKAIPEYRAALKASPNDARLRNQLAATLALVGDRAGMEEGLTLVDAAMQQKTHYLAGAQLRDTRADLLYRLDRKAEALAAYRELSGVVGGMQGPVPWHRYGELAQAAGDRTVARNAYERALDFGRPYPDRAKAVEQLQVLSKPRGS